MAFQCINIRQVPWEVLKTAASGLGFQHLPRDMANVNAWKPMFNPYIGLATLHAVCRRISSCKYFCSEWQSFWTALKNRFYQQSFCIYRLNADDILNLILLFCQRKYEGTSINFEPDICSLFICNKAFICLITKVSLLIFRFCNILVWLLSKPLCDF